MPYKCKCCDRLRASEKQMSKPLEKQKCLECVQTEIRLFGRELSL